MNRHHYLNNMNLFRPKQIINRFNELDIKKYKELGFNTIFLDIDNTIAVPDQGKLEGESLDFVNELITNGFKVLIFSNNNIKRVKKFVNNNKNVYYWAFACKPFPFAYWINCLRINSKLSKTIVLGDQLITDILGANLSKTYGIYTKKLVEKDSPWTSKTRKIEKYLWRHLNNEEM